MSLAISDDRITLLQSMPIFGGISADSLRLLLGLARPTRVGPGRYFYREGDPASSLFVLELGAVCLLKSWCGQEYLVKSLHRGDCFGEVALIDLQPRNTSAYATAECEALEITADHLYRLYQRDLPQFTLIYMNMAREVCRRLRETDQRAFASDREVRLIRAEDG